MNVQLFVLQGSTPLDLPQLVTLGAFTIYESFPEKDTPFHDILLCVLHANAIHGALPCKTHALVALQQKQKVVRYLHFHTGSHFITMKKLSNSKSFFYIVLLGVFSRSKSSHVFSLSMGKLAVLHLRKYGYE